MAWTAFPTWAVGQVSLASDWNTYVASNVNFLATPPILSVYRSSALNATSGAWTVTPFDTVTQDSQSGYSVSTHKYTTAVAGTYQCTVATTWTEVSDSYAFGVGLQVNGSGQYAQVTMYSGAATGQQGCCLVKNVPGCVAGTTTISGIYFNEGAYGFVVGNNPVLTYMDILKVSN